MLLSVLCNLDMCVLKESVRKVQSYKIEQETSAKNNGIPFSVQPWVAVHHGKNLALDLP